MAGSLSVIFNDYPPLGDQRRVARMIPISQPQPHLNLWKQRLGRVPESVWKQVDLETLVLADNDLTEVPAKIGDLK